MFRVVSFPLCLSPTHPPHARSLVRSAKHTTIHFHFAQTRRKTNQTNQDEMKWKNAI